MKKELNLGVTLIDRCGIKTFFNNIDECAIATGLSARAVKLRATSEKPYKGIVLKWTDSSTKRSFIGRKSRRKGNGWELDIITHLKEAGYSGCVSSRSESKRTDDAKVDIVDINNELPCYIQAKRTKNFPSYHKIEEACTMKDKPFVIACKLEGKKTPVAILPLDYFYELIKRK